MEGTKEKVGRVTHYFSRIGVAVIELESELKVGDEISMEGATTNFKQKVASMEIEHKKVDVAKAGQSVGLKVEEKVRPGDVVYKVGD